MPIYTKTGDRGKTSLFGGRRVFKYDLQVEAYGAVDEATSSIGFAFESVKDTKIKELLTEVQMALYSVMAYLSGAKLDDMKLDTKVLHLEKNIDFLEKKLPKLVRFILPQGSETTVRLHLARASVRTAERRIGEFIHHKKDKNDQDDDVLRYINRLSDLLFMLARNYSRDERLT